MKVLMTGCTGQAGTHALNHFVNNGHEVHALVSSHHIPKLDERDNVTWVAGGFAETELISAPAADCDEVEDIGASTDEACEMLDTNVRL